MSEHGTIGRYNNGGCRCDPCRSTFSRTWAERKEAYAVGPLDNCQICGSKGPLFWDHEHATERHRGWLCRGCNSLLGYFKESPVLLERAANYLEGVP